MASFFTSLLVAQFLVSLADSAVPSSGDNKLPGALTNNSLQNKLLVVNNGSSILSELEQGRKPQRTAPPRAQSAARVMTPEEADMIQLRLQMIKVQILKKLHMDHEPKHIARPDVRLPEPLADLSIDDNKREENVADQSQHKTTQVIVMADKAAKKIPVADGQSSVPDKVSLRFRFTENIYTNSIGSAFLWIRKRQNSNLGGHNVRISLEPSAKKNKRFIRTKIKTKGSWLIISLKRVVQNWMEQDRSENAPDSTSFVHSLEVSCTNCQAHANGLLATAGKYRPFLIIDILSPSGEEAPRKKRSVECQEHVKDCCLQRFYVTFKELNWSDWIVQPKGFYANFCKGSCKGAVATKYHHTYLMRKLSASQSQLEPCCVPTKLSGLSLLYYASSPSSLNGSTDSDRTLFKRDLPHMRVDECGCT